MIEMKPSALIETSERLDNGGQVKVDACHRLMTSVWHEDNNLELVSGSGDYKLSPTLVMVALLECHRDKGVNAVA
ncbi:hypothetical protein HZ326_2283 [Fusarium oxysporum f. sp. albedinis]|nr:hypothetical protein HZ326_2283 [Fusarium oxysporum f. sp. albedinis]